MIVVVKKKSLYAIETCTANPLRAIGSLAIPSLPLFLVFLSSLCHSVTLTASLPFVRLSSAHMATRAKLKDQYNQKLAIWFLLARGKQHPRL